MSPPVEVLEIPVDGPGLREITREVRAVVERADVRDGLCTVYIQHTSASLTIQENADPAVRRDLQAWLARLVPENDPLYTHTAEGADDMPAHIKAALTGSSVGVPIVGGRLALGTWQGIFLWEHRAHRGRRRLLIHIGV